LPKGVIQINDYEEMMGKRS